MKYVKYMILSLCLNVLSGCFVSDQQTQAWLHDADGDGVVSCEFTSKRPCDCNDSSADFDDDGIPDGRRASPGQIESCDAIDNNCDGNIDENQTLLTWYLDADGDGYGDAAHSLIQCGEPEGYVSNAEDCGDADDSVHPYADETCEEGDKNCDDSAGDLDQDGDGVKACRSVENPVADCNDQNATIYPATADLGSAPEHCDGLDNDCDQGIDDDDPEGIAEPQDFHKDEDGDGYGEKNDYSDKKDVLACSLEGYSQFEGDCNDSSKDPVAPQIHPGAEEICNNLDDDCDDLIDERLVLPRWLQDKDRDSFGNVLEVKETCTQPIGYVADPGASDSYDCDDDDPERHPYALETCDNDAKDLNCDGYWGVDDNDRDGVPACKDCDDGTNARHGAYDDIEPVIEPVPESCDGLDNDCNTRIDDAGVQNWYPDADGDSFTGDVLNPRLLTGCNIAGFTLKSAPSDCDDVDPTSYPGAVELCDGVDNNCEDGTTEEQDLDHDGYPACLSFTSGLVKLADCDDDNSLIAPNRTEFCDEVDNDCDGGIDEYVETIYYRDRDEDGHGTATSTTWACAMPDGYSSLSDDCDDREDSVHPGAIDEVNGIDDDCNGIVDDGAFEQYVDGDGDHYGDCAKPSAQKANTPGYASVCGDCNDSDASVNPRAVEICDGVDKNCDGNLDEDLKHTFYRDADGDKHGSTTNSMQACSPQDGYVAIDDDCHDGNDSIHPGAEELCDEIDNDCDGTIDQGEPHDYYSDSDGDSYGSSLESPESSKCAPPNKVRDSTDCNDADPNVNPSANEVCGNDLDDNCDGITADAPYWYADLDGDGHGDSTAVVSSCEQPLGYVENGNDCLDNDATVYPGAVESCDNQDNNCDGRIDDADPNVVDRPTWYRDGDSDGFGNPATSNEACTNPEGYVSNNTDCNDASASCNPDADELEGDGLDNDCDGYSDEPKVPEGTDIYVSSTGQSPAGTTIPGTKSLIDAVENAADGSTILVGDGEYATVLDLNGKDLTVVSENGSNATTLLGDGEGSVILLVGGTLTLRGFTISGGTGTPGDDPSGCGSGANANESSGGGICARDATLTLEDVIFDGNTATYGGELYVRDSNTMVTDAQFLGASGARNGGGYYQYRGTSTLSGVTVSSYHVSGEGGGLYVYGGDLSLIDSSVLTHNTAVNGGGLYFSGGSKDDLLFIDDSLFVRNMSTTYGGGLLITGPLTAYIASSEFDSNSSNNSNAGGGGAYISVGTGGDLTMTGLEVMNNVSNGSCGGMLLSLAASTTAKVSDSVWHDNIGAVDGGGLCYYSSSTSASLERSTFDNNSAGYNGGGLYAGGVVKAVVKNVSVRHNAAGNQGGGVYLAGGTLQDSDIASNQAYDGGGLATTGATNLTRVQLLQNDADRWGGGLFMGSGTSTVRSLLVSNNTAVQTGGGIFLYDGSGGSILNATVSQNRSWINAGGIYLSGLTSMALSSSIIAFNSAPDGGSNVMCQDSTACNLTDMLLFNPPEDKLAMYGLTEFALQNNRIVQADPRFIRDPRYAGIDLHDYHLRPDSPAKNMGAASSGDKDPDGTRNDMGYYGGKYATTGKNLDGDNLPDDWEALYHLNPDVNDATGDLDQDGLSNSDEYAKGLAPDLADTDSDGISDANELSGGSNPLDPFDPGIHPDAPRTAFVPDDFDTVQEAIDFAFPGSRVRVRAGTYTGNLFASLKAFALDSEAGANATTLKGDGKQSVLVLYALPDGMTVEGFTITGGKGVLQNNDSYRKGGAVFMRGSDAKFYDLIIRNNTASLGGGLYQDGGVLQVDGCLIELNTTVNNIGGGFYLNSAETHIQNSIFRKNASGDGGGLFLNQGVVTLRYVQFRENTAIQRAGGFYQYGGNLVLEYSGLSGNQAGYQNTGYGAGGAYVYSGSSSMYCPK